MSFPDPDGVHNGEADGQAMEPPPAGSQYAIGWWAAQPVAIRTAASVLTVVSLVTIGLLVAVGQGHGYATAQDVLFGLRSAHSTATEPGTGVAGTLLSVVGYLLVPSTVGASAGVLGHYVITARLNRDRKSLFAEALAQTTVDAEGEPSDQ